MSQDRLAEYLKHMQQAATDACDFVEGLSKDQFLTDKRTQQAVIMSLVIIGEAATKLMDKSPEFVNGNPQLPWRQMRGMRNRIAHGYFAVNLDIVWDTTQTALPNLLNQLSGLDINGR